MSFFLAIRFVCKMKKASPCLAVLLMVVLVFLQERLDVYKEKLQRCTDRSKGKH